MRFLFGVIFSLMISVNAFAQSFLPKTEDLPQMPGLNAIEEVANFDFPNERLLILSATTTKSISEVERFYSQTLKNLGWSETKKNFYQRQNDSFQIEMSQKGNKTFVQFTLSQEN